MGRPQKGFMRRRQKRSETEKEMWQRKQKANDAGTDWQGGRATSQGPWEPRESGSWQGKTVSQSFKRNEASQHLDFSSEELTSDFWSPEL